MKVIIHHTMLDTTGAYTEFLIAGDHLGAWSKLAAYSPHYSDDLFSHYRLDVLPSWSLK